MSIWAEIKKALNSDFLNEPLNVKTDRIEDDTQDIQTNVGSNADSSSAIGSVHAKLKDLKTTSAIKSIQRGTVNLSSSDETVTISSVTESKTFINLLSTLGTTNTANVVLGVVLTDSTTLTFNPPGSNSVSAVKWEVIEYV